ncbi:hypothetical protein KYX90_13410, partial [Enterococcus lactis]|uniref:hypothetical protein n=1 Tax=Enterococcus lactis TaxID=357441 RepID=UPI001C7CE2C4
KRKTISFCCRRKRTERKNKKEERKRMENEERTGETIQTKKTSSILFYLTSNARTQADVIGSDK